MSTFIIDAENNIIAHAELPAGADESHRFPPQRSWPNSPRNGRHPAWSTLGIASRVWRLSTN
jgi:hypothetical protein